MNPCSDPNCVRFEHPGETTRDMHEDGKGRAWKTGHYPKPAAATIWQRYALDARSLSPEQIDARLSDLVRISDPSRPVAVLVIADGDANVQAFLDLRDKEPPPG